MKSPSRYFPKACRTTVITAIRGFTTQNCSVACRGRQRAAVERRKSGGENAYMASNSTNEPENTQSRAFTIGEELVLR